MTRNRGPDPRTWEPRRPITATYDYYPNGFLRSVTFGNGASPRYGYDGEGHVTRLEHRNGAGDPILTTTYAYDWNGLPTSFEETDAIGAQTMGVMGYDAAHRLTMERRINYGNARVPTYEVAYDVTYQYDLGGNRVRKVDAVAHTETLYTYDISAPDRFGSANNRLMYYEVKSLGHPTIADGSLLSTTWNYYNCSGNITRVVTLRTGATRYMATRLEYGPDDRTVHYEAAESWNLDGTGYRLLSASEYRYDSDRARYRMRKLDVDKLLTQHLLAAAPTRWLTDGTAISVLGVADVWTDYDGDRPYEEYTPNVGQLSEYEPGIARSVETQGLMLVEYEHMDAVGSLQFGSNASGAATTERLYTAFGEPVSNTSDNYGYCSVWGYQSGATVNTTDAPDLPFLHVGARYYDPASGRFLQRDPAGIDGGLNVYAYVENSPTVWIDPDGNERKPPSQLPGDVGRLLWKDGKKLLGKLAGLCTWVAETAYDVGTLVNDYTGASDAVAPGRVPLVGPGCDGAGLPACPPPPDRPCRHEITGCGGIR